MKKLKCKELGLASIEFVAVFPLFLLLCAAWIEMSYMSYISSVTDFAVSASSREAKTCSDKNCTYDEIFKQTIQDQTSLWGKFINVNQLQLTIMYLDNVQDFVTLPNDYCPSNSLGNTITVCGNSGDSPIAIYRVSYSYKPMLNLFLKTHPLLVSEMITIQEHERALFKI